jgi:hypothetical protein
MLLNRRLLISALDSVLGIQGLWRSFYIGLLYKILGLECNKVSIRLSLVLKL